MGAHAILAPSSAFRWVKCALSVTLEAAYPETEPSPSSLEGTAAHWVVQMLLAGTPATLGQQAPNGIAVTREMLEGAALVQDEIVAKLGMEWRAALFVERKVDIPRVHPTLNWGTPDLFAWSRMDNGGLCLHIWDYKFGWGVVEAFENWQLVDYVAGILAQVDARDMEVVVDMAIIQPRAYHRDGPVRHWRVVASELRAMFNILENAAGEALQPDPRATVTPEGCANCRGRHACEALLREAGRIADQAQSLGAVELPPHALGLQLRSFTRAQSILKACVTGLEADAAARIKKGVLVPFWSMESTPGRLDWTKPVEEVLALGQMLGVELAKPADVITPTQAKAAGIPESLLDSYAKRPAGSAKLTYDDGTKARLTFSSSNTQ